MTKSGLKPTYHLAPNLSILPPPDGPLHLGSVIMSLEDPEVLNSDCRIEPAKTWTHKKNGFKAKWSRIRSGEYGVWAEFLGVTGVGGEGSFGHERSDEDEYSFVSEDTTYFSPSIEYLKDSMNQPAVVQWVEVLNQQPVYMVTGLKIARGPSVKLTQNRKWNTKVKVGVQVPDAPVQLGPAVEHSNETGHEESWSSSDDFIFGIRVLKLVYKRSWFHRHAAGQLQPKPHTKGAKLVGADDMGEEDLDDDVVAIDLDEDELDGKEVLQSAVDEGELIGDEEPAKDESEESGVGVSWVVPKRDSVVGRA